MHQVRILAIQGLYQHELMKFPGKRMNPPTWDPGINVSSETRKEAGTLIEGTTNNVTRLRQEISRFLTNGTIEEVKLIDRAILMLSVYSLLFLKDIPAKVVINEAVILAKEFSSDNAHKFINGILDAIRKNIN